MRLAIAAMLLLAAPPALADQPPAAPPVQPEQPPAPSISRPDAARLAAAGRLIDLIMPRGTMQEVMSDLVPSLDTVLALTAERFGIDTTGMDREQRARAVEEFGARSDRHFRERLAITLDVSRRVAAEILVEMEPEMRSVMVTMTARQFSVAEIGEMLAFFSTPTGWRYARMTITMTQDPAWQEMLTLVAPRMLGMAARIEEAVRAGTAHLDPAPRI
jgi:hypothetical protein